jgi:thioredoxin-like negative regulator of GroEL
VLVSEYHLLDLSDAYVVSSPGSTEPAIQQAAAMQILYTTRSSETLDHLLYMLRESRRASESAAQSEASKIREETSDSLLILNF